MAETSSGGRRTRRVVQAGISAIFSKGIVLLVNAISIPIVVRYLGPVEFGIWITISTALALFLVLDLGIAGALTNLISEAYARENKTLAGRYASSAFWMIVLISAALGVIGRAVWPHIPWAAVFHLSQPDEAKIATQAVAVACIIFLAGLPAGLAAKILGAYQELSIANPVAAAASVANLLAVIATTRLHGGLIALVAAPAAATVAVNFGCLVWIWLRHKPWLAPSPHLCDRGTVRRLLAGGSDLFILQLASLIVFSSDNFIILHYLGPADVTPYSVTWKLVGYAAALQLMVTPALWPAYAEAYVRGDMAWIRRTLRNVMVSSMAVASAACVIFLLWGRLLIRLWAGPAAVPREDLIVAMCVWALISTFMSNISTLLTATNSTRLLSRTNAAAVVVNLALSIWLVHRIGSLGVILGTILSYVVFLIGPQTWKAVTVLKAPPPDQSSAISEDRSILSQ